jgi:hypothetical protein
MRTSLTNMCYMCGMCSMPEDIFALIGECDVFVMHKK